MTDDEEITRLRLATRLHGATMPVIERLMTTDGAPTIGELHVICNVAERVERAGDVYGTSNPLFTTLLVTLMRTTEDVRSYVDERMQEVIAERAARADPEAALKALEEIADVPPEPGDEMPADVADAIEDRLRHLDDRVIWRHSDGTLYRLRRRPGESDNDYSEREQRLAKLRSLVLPADPREAAAAIERLGLEKIGGSE